MERICKLCNVSKSLEEFRRNKKNQLGRDWQCKKCRYEKQARPYFLANKEKCYANTDKWAKRNRERINEKSRENYANDPVKFLERQKKYDEKTGIKAKILQKYRENNRQKVNAQCQLRDHVKRGNIIKPNKCSLCSSEKWIEAHHADYSKPLEVVWVCKKCHAIIHRGFKNQMQPERLNEKTPKGDAKVQTSDESGRGESEAVCPLSKDSQ